MAPKMCYHTSVLSDRESLKKKSKGVRSNGSQCVNVVTSLNKQAKIGQRSLCLFDN